MKASRSILFLSLVLLAGTIADAQCLRCYREPGTFGGTCGEQPYSYPEYCDRDCCGANIGDPCRVPDFVDPCDPWLRSASREGSSVLKVSAKAKPVPPAAYFTTRRPLEKRQEAIHRRLQQLDPSAPKCGSA